MNRKMAGYQRQILECQQGAKPTGRPGNALMCVLIVLLLIGMLALQTTQALSSSRRSLMQQSQIRQARELIEYTIQLGRLHGFKDSSQIIPVDSANQLTGKVTIRITQDHASGQSVRIVASYPFGKPSAVTASSEIKL